MIFVKNFAPSLLENGLFMFGGNQWTVGVFVQAI